MIEAQVLSVAPEGEVDISFADVLFLKLLQCLLGILLCLKKTRAPAILPSIVGPAQNNALLDNSMIFKKGANLLLSDLPWESAKLQGNHVT